jgi:protein-S-isoprenylcysteine O-methyltransferase Ste14
MDWLELKIPPLALTLGLAVAMVLVDALVPATSFAHGVFWPGLAIVLAGAVVCALGVREFRRARTTVDPRTPQAASDLVRGGIYGRTRNPMYVGFLLVLAGVAVTLLNWLALALAVLFVPYMNRWQIGPEERALDRVFGDAFHRYRREVRRWV